MLGDTLLFDLLMAARRRDGWRLSHGERARVWIARALLQRAKAVVIDEGLDALDPPNLRRIQDVLLDEPGAVLVIAHT